jgi:hypothetical protein
MACQRVARQLPHNMRSRFYALYPGGCISKLLAAERSAVLIVGMLCLPLRCLSRVYSLCHLKCLRAAVSLGKQVYAST